MESDSNVTRWDWMEALDEPRPKHPSVDDNPSDSVIQSAHLWPGPQDDNQTSFFDDTFGAITGARASDDIDESPLFKLYLDAHLFEDIPGEGAVDATAMTSPSIDNATEQPSVSRETPTNTRSTSVTTPPTAESKSVVTSNSTPPADKTTSSNGAADPTINAASNNDCNVTVIDVDAAPTTTPFVVEEPTDFTLPNWGSTTNPAAPITANAVQTQTAAITSQDASSTDDSYTPGDQLLNLVTPAEMASNLETLRRVQEVEKATTLATPHGKAMAYGVDGTGKLNEPINMANMPLFKGLSNVRQLKNPFRRQVVPNSGGSIDPSAVFGTPQRPTSLDALEDLRSAASPTPTPAKPSLLPPAPVHEPEYLDSYARLKFPDGTFHMTTYNVIVGRDMLVRKTVARPQGQAQRPHNSDMPFSASYVSAEGGFMGPPGSLRTSRKRKRAPGDARSRKSHASSTATVGGPDSDEAAATASAANGPDTANDAANGDETAPGSDDEDMLKVHQTDREYIYQHTPGSVELQTALHRPEPNQCVFLGIHSPGPNTISNMKSISRQHMRISYNLAKRVFEAITIHRNGFFLNDELIQSRAVVLRSGDRLQIKDVAFTFHINHVRRGCTGAERGSNGGKDMSFDFEAIDADPTVARDTSEDDDSGAHDAQNRVETIATVEGVNGGSSVPVPMTPPAATSQAQPPKLKSPRKNSSAAAGGAAPPGTQPSAPDVSLAAQAALAPVVLEAHFPDGPPRKRGPGRPPKNGMFSLRQMKERLEDPTLPPDQRVLLEAQYQLLKQKKKTPKTAQAAKGQNPQQDGQPGPSMAGQQPLSTPMSMPAYGDQQQQQLQHGGKGQDPDYATQAMYMGHQQTMQQQPQLSADAQVDPVTQLAYLDNMGPWMTEGSLADAGMQLGLSNGADSNATNGGAQQQPAIHGGLDGVSPTMARKILQLQDSIASPSDEQTNGQGQVGPNGQHMQHPQEQQLQQQPFNIQQPLQGFENLNVNGGSGGMMPAYAQDGSQVAGMHGVQGVGDGSMGMNMGVGMGGMAGDGSGMAHLNNGDGTTPTKRKVGRPRKHPLPEGAVDGQQKRYKARKPRSGDEDESDNAADRERSNSSGGNGLGNGSPDGPQQQQQLQRRERHKTPPLQLNIEDYSEEQLEKPNKSYGVLIDEVLQEANPPGLTLKQIYKRIQEKYLYFFFVVETKGWESSVRHNLIGNVAFAKDEKTQRWHRVPGVELDAGKKARKGTSPERVLAGGNGMQNNSLQSLQQAGGGPPNGMSAEYWQQHQQQQVHARHLQQQQQHLQQHQQQQMQQQQLGRGPIDSAPPPPNYGMPQQMQHQHQPQHMQHPQQQLPSHPQHPPMPTGFPATPQRVQTSSPVKVSPPPVTLAPPGMAPAISNTPAHNNSSDSTATPPMLATPLSATATKTPPVRRRAAVPPGLAKAVDLLKAHVLEHAGPLAGFAEELVMAVVNRSVGLTTAHSLAADQRPLEDIVFQVFEQLRGDERLDAGLVAQLVQFKQGFADLVRPKLGDERADLLILSALDRVLGFTDRSTMRCEAGEAEELEQAEALIREEATAIVQAWEGGSD